MMRRLTHLSLFSGIGGLDLAAERAGMRTVGQCEWADYPTKVLEKHWPDVPRWRDIRTLTQEDFYGRTGLQTVDVISGGFPCQPFSTAGKRRGKEDDRYLWPEMLRVIKELQPTWIVGENVAGIVSLALDQVLSDMEAVGYEARTIMVPACGVDAPHRRYRVAIMGYAKHNGSSTTAITGGISALGKSEQKKETIQPAGASGRGHDQNVAHPCSAGLCYGKHDQHAKRWDKQTQFEPAECGTHVADTIGIRCRPDSNHAAYDAQRDDTSHQQKRQPEFCATGSGSGAVPDTAGKGLQGYNDNTAQQDGGYRKRQFAAADRTIGRSKWDAESGLGGMADGISRWLDEPVNIPRLSTGDKDRVARLKALGNAVVPQQFYPIFKGIVDIERGANT